MKRILIFTFLFSSCLFSDQFPRIKQKVRTIEEKPENVQASYFLTGDWNGARSMLEQKGVTFISSYFTELVGNPSGGQARGFTYTGAFTFALQIDLEKAFGANGLLLFSSMSWRTGTSLSARKIKNFFEVQEIYGLQSVRLVELYLRGDYCNERILFKLGQLCAGNHFLASPLYFPYLNNAFCGNPKSPFVNTTLSVFPVATWGAYLEVKPFDWLSVKAASFNANSNIYQNKYHGVNFTFKSTNGVLWATEWVGLVNQRKDSRGMPGNYKLGFLYQTGKEHKYSDGNVKGNSSFYILVDQMIYRAAGRQSNRGLTPFAAVIFAPKDRNRFPFFYDLGLYYQGPFASRPYDSASFGLAYGRFSSDLAKEEKVKGLPPQNYEAIVELSYWIQATHWCSIVPDLQYVIRPNGLNIPNAFCLGVQVGILL